MIIVGGTIGGDKVTYMKILAESLASQAFFRRDQTMPALNPLFDNPPGDGLLSQVYLPTTRIASLRRAAVYARNLTDGCISEDLLHAQVAYELGHMDQRDKAVYDILLKELMHTMNDLILKDQKCLFVLLKGSLESFLSEVDFSAYSDTEKQILTEYYRAIHLRYDRWMQQFYTPSQLLVVEMGNYDVSNKEDQARLVRLVHTHVEALDI